VHTLSALDHLTFAFACDWPLDIILDQRTITGKYNPILRFLLKIRRAVNVLSKRDYWQAKRLERLRNTKTHLNVREHIVEKNR
jgi:hypothetical protein